MNFTKSSTFETMVLSQSYKNDQYFQKLGDQNSSTNQLFSRPENPVNEPEPKYWKLCWWQPKKSLLAQYFQHGTMHGMKYLAQPRRHLSERIFWFISVLLSAITTAYLVYVIWVRYNKSPVIVSFNPQSILVEEIPFPAVTICNMNKISKDTINQLMVRAHKKGNGNLARTAQRNLRYVKNMCDGAKTFSKEFGFASKRGQVDISVFDYNNTRPGDKIYSFLAESSAPCSEMIRACFWNNRKRNCSDLFKITFTYLGRCCTFNRLPPDVLYNPKISKWFAETVTSKVTKKEKYDKKEIRLWRGWNYHEGFIKTNTTRRPRSQNRPGSPFGLSVLLDPAVGRYFCPTSDSLGLRLSMHTAVDAAPIMSAKAIELNQEIYMELVPTITIADPNLHSFKFERRQCLYAYERELKFYKPYTQQNCYAECFSENIRINCSCVPYNIIRPPNTPICSTDPYSNEFECSSKVIKIVAENIHKMCPSCMKLCASLSYQQKIMSATLQNHSKLWMDHSDKLLRPPDWANNNMTILHLYFGNYEYSPRIRREMYGTVDLIANTGNLVTLFLGVSVLSAVEMIYFGTARALSNWLRKRTVEPTNENEISPAEMKNKKKEDQPYVINVQPFEGSQKMSTFLHGPSAFFMSHELYNPEHFLQNAVHRAKQN